MQREEKEMNECVTKEELNTLEERMTNRQNRIEDKISDICKGQARMSEKIVKIESTTDGLKESISSFNTRLIEQKDAIIKEITYLAVTKQGTELFKNKLGLEISKVVIWFIAIAVTAAITTAVNIYLIGT